ncbi:hypothetical protein DPQ25_10540 [Hydrogeniiclostridium mannosilyticum]|uniref:Uncharacterized protein n=1 Tax=Hydrogeniiclostridium mannosilyticum TaxID=2764322 RepID=A0A328UA27_9FIRM|nr:hypothetical protein DPQ25_10540 [Hydrogeniiclostridium mannosilyticum]
MLLFYRPPLRQNGIFSSYDAIISVHPLPVKQKENVFLPAVRFSTARRSFGGKYGSSLVTNKIMCYAFIKKLCPFSAPGK